MKIGIVCFPSYGGSGAMATELGLNLAKRGHKVHFISSETPFRLVGSWHRNVFFHRVDEPAYPLFKSDELYSLALAGKIAEVVKEAELDLVHAHYSLPHATSLFLANAILHPKVKTVITLHGTDVTIFAEEDSVGQITKMALKKANCITAVCKFLANEAKEEYSLKKVKVIYNFVNIKKQPLVKSKELREIFAKPNEKILIHASNFREVKRIQDVLETFAKINKKVPSKLLLIGDGPQKDLAQKMASKLKVIDRVHFMGLQNNISRLLSIADLMLLPSEKEAFSLSALEAMSCGVVVVGTKVGGMAEMIEHDKEGFLSEVGNTAEMAENAIKVLESPKYFKEVVKSAKEKVKKNFSADVITTQYENAYRRVLREN